MEAAFKRVNEKDKSPISKFKSPEVIGAPKAGKQIKNFCSHSLQDNYRSKTAGNGVALKFES